MLKRNSEHGQTVVIQSATELFSLPTRRGFLRTLLAGGTAVMLPSVFTACNDDSTGPDDDEEIPDPVTGLSFNLTTDVGIFRLLHLQEQVEAAFYTAVVNSDVFAVMNAADRELFLDLRDVEITHREFIRTALGAQALPDIRGSLNTATINTIISNRTSIITTARMLEHTGLAGLNGTGKYIQDVRNLLVAGKLASVEARHAAALRDLLPPPGVNANTAFASDDIIDANGRDVKLEADGVLQKDASTGLLMSGTLASPPITAGPTAAQGVPTPDFFPATA
jgi:hypothetical protein